MGLDVARLRLGDAEFRVEKYITGVIQEVADEEFTERAQKKAWRHGFSEKVIGSIRTEVEFNGPKWDIYMIWDYTGDKGEPIAVFLEDGVNAHPIEAKGKAFGGADYLAWMSKNGKMVFRKKVNHPGYAGFHVMRDAYREGLPLFTKKLEKKTQEFMDLNRLVN